MLPFGELSSARSFAFSSPLVADKCEGETPSRTSSRGEYRPQAVQPNFEPGRSERMCPLFSRAPNSCRVAFRGAVQAGPEAFVSALLCMQPRPVPLFPFTGWPARARASPTASTASCSRRHGASEQKLTPNSFQVTRKGEFSYVAKLYLAKDPGVLKRSFAWLGERNSGGSVYANSSGATAMRVRKIKQSWRGVGRKGR